LREHFGDDYRGKHPLNWELEFPEVFFTGEGVLKENAGFDVVVGNPPYVRQERLGEDKPYLERAYRVYHGVADLYAYFIELGVGLLKEGGIFSYIVSNKWMRANYGEPLRRWMREQQIEEIVDFGGLPVFSETTTYPCILRIRKGAPSMPFRASQVKTLDFSNLESYVKEHTYLVNQSTLDDGGWSLSDEREQALLDKLKGVGVPLGEYVDGKIYRGVLTGLNKAFVIDEKTKDRLIAEDAKSAELIKPFLVGRDIKRYETPSSDNYLIFTRRGVNIEEYPAIKRHLSTFKDELMPKPADWSGGEWKGRKQGTYQWYEIQDTIDYYEEFEKEKICWGNLCKESPFTIDKRGSYVNAPSCILLAKENLVLLSYLNSKLLWWFLKKISAERAGGFIEAKPIYVSQIPIPQIPLTTPSPEREQHLQELKELHTSYIETGDLAPTLDRVREHLSATPERSDAPNRSDVVHELLAFLAERMMQLKKQQKELLDLIPADSSIRFRNIRRDLQSWHISLLADTRVSDFKEFRGVKIKEFKLRYEDNTLVVFHEERGELLRLAFDDESFKKYMALMFAHWIERKGARTFRGEIELPSTLNLHLSIPTVLEELERRVGESDVVRLTEELERTDREIDRIVYELYGLTEDEIRLVEESLT